MSTETPDTGGADKCTETPDSGGADKEQQVNQASNKRKRESRGASEENVERMY